MNPAEKAFSILFILMMIGCILFEVESWPFSDWRVYQYTKKPSDIRVFQVRLQKEDKIIDPLDYSVKIDLEFNSFYYANNKESLKDYCSQLFEQFKRSYRFDLFTIVIIRVDDEMNMNYQTICSQKIDDTSMSMDWK